MIKYFLAVLLLVRLCALAQQERWHSGAIVDSNQEVIVGKFLFQQAYDLLVVKHADQTAILPVWRIQSFRFYDSAAHMNRKFVSLGGFDGVIESRLYEVVVEGTIRVVRREKLFGTRIASGRDSYDYWFVQEHKRIPLIRFRTALYPQIRGELSKWEEELSLNPNRHDDAIRYVQLYNRLRSDMHWVAAR